MQLRGSLARHRAGMVRTFAIGLVCAASMVADSVEEYSVESAESFLRSHCDACHGGDAPIVGFRTDDLKGVESLGRRPEAWLSLASRVANGEMPPKGSPSPSRDERLEFVAWVEDAWRTQACEAGLELPGAPFRRLNRDEYSAMVRDLLDIQIDVSEMLPVDGPGGEGFDNAAETLFVSPLLTEKYLDAAKFALDVASKEFKSRRLLLIGRPGGGATEPDAVRKILARFLPRAFRRPVTQDTVKAYVRLFRKARRRGLEFEPAVLFAMRSALVSPSFTFHVTTAAGGPDLRQYALASRLSYFLWGSMPDELLLDLAAQGVLDEPSVLARLVPRMLRDDRALEFSTRFVEQWLRTRELEGAGGPDAELFPEYAASAELRGDIRLQPVFFFREVFRENRSLLEFLDSRGTVLTKGLIEHMGLPMKKEQDGKNPNWMELPEGSGRGGLLGMPAIAALASHPHRTSPVLRGVWVLDSVLGTPPPPPPPDVPELPEPASGTQVATGRDLLAAHSRNPACASCHDRIDPIGVALENYDVVGRWRDEDAGQAVDASGRLPDGTRLEGPMDLKRALLDRKTMFVRNLARRMLGYALGRGLTAADACAVEKIVKEVAARDYSAWSLVRHIVLSEQFLR